jgi:molecular chaperone GrpE
MEEQGATPAAKPALSKAEGPEGPGAEVARLKDQLLRLQADFENARRRWRQEQAQVQERANADVLRELLEIYDDFQRALSAKASDANHFIAGVEMISRRLQDFLKSYGIAPIEAVGKPFDPSLHEAVAHEVSEAVPEATVLEELRKGYQMNGKVLRTAVVKVSKKKEDLENGASNRD